MAPTASGIVAFIGIATALFAATMALAATDIKRVLAYSTVSQLGYMVFAVGVGAYAAGIFHLVTHAFFKALLFLGAGAVIHALAGEQDMRKMGNLRGALPTTHWTMRWATLAIAGIFPFAGFWSKDEILAGAIKAGGINILWWLVGLVTAFLTAFYMFRLFYLTFYGTSRVEHARRRACARSASGDACAPYAAGAALAPGRFSGVSAGAWRVASATGAGVLPRQSICVGDRIILALETWC